MNDISIKQFRDKAVGGGDLTLDSQKTGLDKKGTSLGGRIVQWFRSIFTPGTVEAENRAVMRAFHKSLRQGYGEEIAGMMTKRLLVDGKPLSSRKVREVLGHANRKLYGYLGYLFSEKDITYPGFKPNPLGSAYASLYDRIATDLGVSAEVSRLRDASDADEMKVRIREDIQQAALDGGRRIDTDEAHDIAQFEIARFILKNTPGKKIDQLDLRGVKVEHLERIANELDDGPLKDKLEKALI
jgi:hypothetical protein